MKFCSSLMAAVLVIAGSVSTANAQLYWDRSNGVAGGGPGGLGNDGTWDTVATNWNSDSGGNGSNVVWTDGSAAVFSAGTNVSGDPIVDSVVTLSGALTPSSILIEEGHIWYTGGGSVAATGGITVAPGARLSLDSSLRVINTTPKISLGNGAALWSVNAGNAGSLVPNAIQIEIDGTGVGFIGYHDQNAGANNQVSVYQGAILGTGGLVDNGGRGTLIKVGPDQLGIGNIDNYLGSGQRSQALMTFAKLEVREGSYRLRHQVSSTSTALETAFGAVPLAELADAILLNGGGIGTNASVTLHANRGITVGTNGGFFDTAAGAGITVPGPFSGSGTFTLDGTSGSGAFTLSHANNVNTFSGKIVANRGTLALSSSLTAADLSGTSAGAAIFGIINPAAGQTFTAGGSNASTGFVGRVGGAGSFTKVGTGTLTLSPAETGGTWTNTGGININGGAIKFGTADAGFSNAVTVSIASGAMLDMNGINDTIGALSGAGTVAMQGAAATPGNLTLATATGTHNFTGNITGGGNLSKTSASTQTLGGTNTLGTVGLTGGTTRFNGANTTGAVTIGGAATVLAGSGSISGAVTNNGGRIAPGGTPNIGTLTLGGGLALETGSNLDFHLGAPGVSDLINVTLANSFSINGATTVNYTDDGGVAAGTYTLIDYAGTLGGSFSNLTLEPDVDPVFDYALNNTGGAITLTVSAVATDDADFNNDGTVDSGDYAIWRKIADPGPGIGDHQTGDADNDGIVDGDDHGIWEEQFNQASPGGGGAVPEPTTFALVLVGLAGLAATRRVR